MPRGSKKRKKKKRVMKMSKIKVMDKGTSAETGDPFLACLDQLMSVMENLAKQIEDCIEAQHYLA